MRRVVNSDTRIFNCIHEQLPSNHSCIAVNYHCIPLTTLLVQSYKLHLGQIGDYPLFVQIRSGNLILRNSNSSDIFLSVELKSVVDIFDCT